MHIHLQFLCSTVNQIQFNLNLFQNPIDGSTPSSTGIDWWGEGLWSRKHNQQKGASEKMQKQESSYWINSRSTGRFSGLRYFYPSCWKLIQPILLFHVLVDINSKCQEFQLHLNSSN